MTWKITLKHEGSLLIVTMENPGKANAMGFEMSRELGEIWHEFCRSDSHRVAILTGSQGCFSAGFDLTELQEGRPPRLPANGFGGLTNLELPKPVIAAVDGLALGGGFELALACDMIVATPDSRFGLPEAKVGQAALAGGIQRLAASVGDKRASDMLLTGRTVDATEGHAMGFVNSIARTEDLMEVCMAIASEIASNAPLSLATTKSVLRAPTTMQLKQMFAQPPDIMLKMWQSDDAVEGMRSFLERRKPNWTVTPLSPREAGSRPPESICDE